MSDLDKLEKKYEKGDKSKDIRQSIAKLKETPSNPDTKRSFERRKETLDSVVRAAKQATAGFRSQWSGLDEEGKVGVGKGTPGIYYNTVAIPAIAGVVDEKYAPDFAVAADKKAGKIKEAVRKDMGINEPKGALEHFSYAGGEMLGQLPVPGALMNKIIGGAKKMGMAGKVAAAPIEYLSPTVDPRALNYGIGTTFGGTMGTVGEALSEEDPVKKALGGLIQKYEDGGKVGKVATFFSAVDKAINTLKQKKGTGEQILKQLEATPGVKPEELESRAIKQKLMASPKITQEELQKTIKANKPPIPKRIKLGAGVDPDWQPTLEKRFQNALEEFNIQPVVDPNTGTHLGFMHPETGEILDANDVRRLDPEELGLPVSPAGKLDPESAQLYNDLRRAVADAQEQFELTLGDTNTKFGQYSKSKGSNNYREILLQHRDEQVPGAAAISQRIDELLKSNPATDEEAAVINKELDSLIDRATSRRQQFNSGHWGEADVLAHYRVSDMQGPNGEKVLYVDEIQSDWHQKARDSRKREVKRLLESERSDLRAKALDEMGDTTVTNENEIKLKSIMNRLTKERKAEIEQQVDENFGYRNYDDDEKLYQLNSKMERLRNTGLTVDELRDYFQPGKIVPSYGGMDKVISFNAGEDSPAFKASYERKLEQAKNAGIDEETASNWAKKRAAEENKYNWSVTVIEVDRKTGQPRKGADVRTHMTSPEKDIVEELRKEASVLESKVPDAPFKKNWHELAVKDILDLAAKEGYDKVAFSPGVEQVKRYETSIRQAVDEIRYLPPVNGEMRITGIKDGSNRFTGDVVDGTFINGPAEGKTLSEVFGAQIAKQIEEGAPNFENLPATKGRGMPDMSADDLLARHYEDLAPDQRDWLENFVRDWEDNVDNSPAGQSSEEEMSAIYSKWLKEQKLGDPEAAGNYGVIRGDNLTVGGEGMKSFYDQRLPSYVKNYAGKEFKAPTSYMEFQNPATGKPPTRQQILDEAERIYNSDDDEFMERMMDRSTTEAARRLEAQGIREATDPDDYSDQLMDMAIGIQEELQDTVLQELAKERLVANLSKGEKIKAFSVDVTPQMKEKITTEGQKLFAATPAIGLGATQVPQQAPAEEEQPQEPPDEPQGFQEGGKVGKLKRVVKKVVVPAYEPNFGAVTIYDQPRNKSVYHATDADAPLMSTKENRLIPNSLSTKANPDGVWGKNSFKINIPKGAKVAEVRSVFDLLPDDVSDTPINIGKALRKYAEENAIDVLKIGRVGGVGTEWAVLNPEYLPKKEVVDAPIVQPDEPQGFQEGGRVGKLKEASEKVLRVLHGGPSRIRLDREKNLDVTTDQGYAIKRAQDKMSQMGQVGPPMVNKFDVPAAKMLRFEETYSPEDVKLMRRFFGKLPEGKAMTGEEIYDATGGKDFVLEGIAKAGGFSGYERPAGGSGGVGNWYRVTDQEALTRKARGGLAQLQKRYR